MVPDGKACSARASTEEGMLTLRLDREVIDWFKSRGARYQTRMNACCAPTWTHISRRTELVSNSATAQSAVRDRNSEGSLDFYMAFA